MLLAEQFVKVVEEMEREKLVSASPTNLMAPPTEELDLQLVKEEEERLQDVTVWKYIAPPFRADVVSVKLSEESTTDMFESVKPRKRRAPACECEVQLVMLQSVMAQLAVV